VRVLVTASPLSSKYSLHLCNSHTQHGWCRLKALLFTLVRGLEFELPVPAADIGRLPGSVVQQPIVRSDRAAGAQMPLLIKPFTQS
jgi:hypothetical protein